MCVYNGAAYLPEQLRSIEAQTRAPDELIVCDDGSTDATVEIVEAFAARAPFPLRLRVNQRNLGSTGNFERAIGLCTGDVIALADQDDVWRPPKLERLAAALAASPDVALVFSDAELVDAESRPLGRRLWDVFGGPRARRQLRSREGALRLLLPACTVTGATMAFRADLRPLALPIPTDIPVAHDGWIALIASAVGRVQFIDEPLMLYRQHAAQQIGTRRKRNVPSSLGSALWRVTSYTDALKTIAEVRRRLQAGAVAADPAVLRELAASAAHFGARSQLPLRWPRRVPLVWRELRSRRYHRYGLGLKSAAKDLLIGPPR